MVELIVTIFAGIGFCASVHFVIGLIEKLDKNAKKKRHDSKDTTLDGDLYDVIGCIDLIISISEGSKKTLESVKEKLKSESNEE